MPLFPKQQLPNINEYKWVLESDWQFKSCPLSAGEGLAKRQRPFTGLRGHMTSWFGGAGGSRMREKEESLKKKGLKATFQHKDILRLK